MPLLRNDIYLVAVCVEGFFFLGKMEKKKKRGGEKKKQRRSCCRTLQAAETPSGAFLKVSRVLAYTQHPSLPTGRKQPARPVGAEQCGKAAPGTSIRPPSTRSPAKKSVLFVQAVSGRTFRLFPAQCVFSFFRARHVDVEGPAALPEIYRLP